MEPASIRYKNPGAMWGNAIARKWGALPKAVVLHDGLGQGNNIAVFPDWVSGICAQLDLWRSSPNYKNKPFDKAIAIWSGGNYVESYITFVLKRVPGMTRSTIMNDTFWQGPMGIAFLKAQAWHEAGKQYPAPDADWIEAQTRVFAVAPHVEAPETKPITHIGDYNHYVGEIQLALGVHPDNVFGLHTQKAVTDFQRLHGLVPDGTVGPKTWKALEQRGILT